mgnify:CR=1 FL=1|jgi:secretion/DNA translocation related TadE-like protein
MVLSERGSASLVAATIVAALAAVTVGGAHVGAAIIARHRAQASADLASLAAAAYVPAGRGIACEQASVLARAMGTSAVTCEVDGLDVVVTVEASMTLGAALMGPARAAARAGPAETGG